MEVTITLCHAHLTFGVCFVTQTVCIRERKSVREGSGGAERRAHSISMNLSRNIFVSMETLRMEYVSCNYEAIFSAILIYLCVEFWMKLYF